MFKKIVKTSMCLLVVSQAAMANSNQEQTQIAKTVVLETTQGAREFGSLDELKAAVQAGEVSAKDLREGVEIAQKALRYEEIKTNVIYTSQALAVASLFLFSFQARYHQGFAEAMANNGTYTPKERAVYVELARQNEATAVKNLARIGIPAAFGAALAVLIPDDRVRLAQELSRLESALLAADRLEQRLGSSQN